MRVMLMIKGDPEPGAAPSEELLTWRVPHHVELAPLLARISTDEQFQFGIRTLPASTPSNLNASKPDPDRSGAAACVQQRSAAPEPDAPSR